MGVCGRVMQGRGDTNRGRGLGVRRGKGVKTGVKGDRQGKNQAWEGERYTGKGAEARTK